jgi:hypothetical protein
MADWQIFADKSESKYSGRILAMNISLAEVKKRFTGKKP